jgi:ribosome recycling factor
MTKSELKSKLEKSFEFLQVELRQVRTGRASPAILDDIIVVAYDSNMHINELASITLMDPQNIVVTPWDKSLLQVIAKSIRESELKLNPIEDTDKIRVQIPALTEERRQEFAKQVTIKTEECKNAFRNIRQDAMKDIDKQFSDKEIGEDEKFTLRDEVEKTLKQFLEDADALGDSKKEELLTV